MGRPVKPIPVGTVFLRLTVIGPAEPINGYGGASLVRCSCGVEKVVRNQNLRSGGVQSCGCYARERASERAIKTPPRRKHGASHSPTYTSWRCMINRCLLPTCTNYPRYGAKGVKVCERWADDKEGFQNFLADMGERPSLAHSIDRIEGPDYEPGNCRWATRPQQNQNVGLKKSNSTGYKGIGEDRRNGVWWASIKANGTTYGIGRYSTKEEAALAYNVASEELHGKHGIRNELPPMDREIVERVTAVVKAVLNKKRG